MSSRDYQENNNCIYWQTISYPTSSNDIASL